MKFTFQIEGSSITELIENIKTELKIIEKTEEEAKKYDQAMKAKCRFRKNKRWEDWEIQILVENYGKKSTKWIASALGRDETTIRSKVYQLSKDYNIKLNKRSKVTKVC